MPTVLGFDFGIARVGIAVGEIESGQAHPLAVIKEIQTDARFAAIGKLLDEWKPVTLVVGLPYQPDGSEHEMSKRCRRFANQLHGRFRVPVEFMDERFTSSEAEHLLRNRGLNWQDRKQYLDAVAAQQILQAYLDTRHATAQSTP